MRGGILLLIARKRKVKVLAALFVTAALINVGFYYTKTMPATVRAAAAEKELAGALKDADAIEGRIKSYDRLLRTREEIKEFKELLPSTSGYTQLLKDMYDLGMKRHMLGDSFGATAKGIKSVGGMEMIAFTYPVSGSYRDVREFIQEVETSDMFLNISNLSLSAGGKDNKIKLNINISTYVRR